MSGFPAEWLALREDADRRATSAATLAALRRWAVEKARAAGRLAIVDLGAGTGSALRRLAPVLSPRQSWLLVDVEPALLDVALRQRFTMGRRIEVRMDLRNLTAPKALAPCVIGADLVTASALLDLTSASWCRALAHALAQAGAALYAPLTYDGRLALEPADALDETVRALVNAHQRRDKGFGPALGPAAAPAFMRLAAADGAVVRAARSDWLLTAAGAALIAPLLRGWVQAAGEMAHELRPSLGAWLRQRCRQLATDALRVRVGHLDVFVRWQGDQSGAGRSRSQSRRTSSPSGKAFMRNRRA